MPADPPESPSSAPPKRGRGSGRPLPSGDANPGSKKSLEARVVRIKELESENVELAEKVRLLRERVAEFEAAGGVSDADPVTSARMWKVMGQDAGLDMGPMEKRLREWLGKDVKGFESRARELADEEAGWERLRVENERLGRELGEARRVRVEEGAEEDGGADRARELVLRILSEAVGAE